MTYRIPCARCKDVGLVRVERVLRGPTLTLEYYCGRCEYTWNIVVPERRAPLTATLRKKEDRRKG